MYTTVVGDVVYVGQSSVDEEKHRKSEATAQWSLILKQVRKKE